MKNLKLYRVLEGPVHVSEYPGSEDMSDGFIVTYLAVDEETKEIGPYEQWIDSLEAFQKIQDYLDEYMKPIEVPYHVANHRPI